MNMEDKVDKVLEEIVEIKIDLKEHMYRTELAEQRIEANTQDLLPVKKAFIGMKWSIGAVITLGAVLTALSKILGYL